MVLIIGTLGVPTKTHMGGWTFKNSEPHFSTLQNIDSRKTNF